MTFEVPDNLKNLNPPKGFDPNAMAGHMRERGFAYAQYEAAYKALDDSTKSVLSKIAGDMEGSEAAKDRAARASDEYIEHLQKLGEARFLYLVSKVNFDVYRVFTDLARSKLSHEKAEMQIL